MDIHGPLSAYLQRKAPNVSYGQADYWFNVRLGPG